MLHYVTTKSKQTGQNIQALRIKTFGKQTAGLEIQTSN